MSAIEEKKYLTDKYATSERMTAADLRMITALLRSPDGCPWDREQTHESVRENFIEETYEVVEAIDNRDPVLLCEELGDVLLQVMFHARMEEERGSFTFDDVCNGICRKLILRHPHVFGDTEVSGTAQVLDNWDAIKAALQESDHRDRDARERRSLSSRAYACGKAARTCQKRRAILMLPCPTTGIPRSARVSCALCSRLARAERMPSASCTRSVTV